MHLLVPYVRLALLSRAARVNWAIIPAILPLKKIAAMIPLQKIFLLIFKTFFSEKGSCDNMLSNLIDSLAVAIYPVA